MIRFSKYRFYNFKKQAVPMDLKRGDADVLFQQSKFLFCIYSKLCTFNQFSFGIVFKINEYIKERLHVLIFCAKNYL